jgi:phosphoribosylformylglycinamidine synthase
MLPVLVLRAAGINCDEEVMHGWRLAGAKPTLLPLSRVAERPGLIDDFWIVTLPGGFSYGDDLGAGTILAQRVAYELVEPLRKLVARGGGVFGICNGFQVLVKAGLLPGEDPSAKFKEQSPKRETPSSIFDPRSSNFGLTVTYNESAKFEARWVRLKVCTDRCPFLGDCGLRIADRGFENRNPIQSAIHNPQSAILEMPVEHAEGRVVAADASVVRELEQAGQIALRYVDEGGRHDTYPANPNGSTDGIAGLCDATGRIFGLMPHPDRYLDPTQHPLWTRHRQANGVPDGLSVFQNAVRYWESVLR